MNLTHCNLPVYLGVTLGRTLSYKAHIEKTKKKVGTRNNIIRKLRTSKWGATPTTLRSSALALCRRPLSCSVRLPGVGALHPCKETGCDTEWNLSSDHRLSEADKYQQSARIRRNRPIRHQEIGGKSYGTDSTNYGPKHPFNGHLGVVPRLKSRKCSIKCTEPINTTAKATRMELWRERLEPLDASVHLNISADVQGLESFSSKCPPQGGPREILGGQKKFGKFHELPRKSIHFVTPHPKGTQFQHHVLKSISGMQLSERLQCKYPGWSQVIRGREPGGREGGREPEWSQVTS